MLHDVVEAVEVQRLVQGLRYYVTALCRPCARSGRHWMIISSLIPLKVSSVTYSAMTKSRRRVFAILFLWPRYPY